MTSRCDTTMLSILQLSTTREGVLIIPIQYVHQLTRSKKLCTTIVIHNKRTRYMLLKLAAKLDNKVT